MTEVPPIPTMDYLVQLLNYFQDQTKIKRTKLNTSERISERWRKNIAGLNYKAFHLLGGFFIFPV